METVLTPDEISRLKELDRLEYNYHKGCGRTPTDAEFEELDNFLIRLSAEQYDEYCTVIDDGLPCED